MSNTPQAWASAFLENMEEQILVYYTGQWYVYRERAGWCKVGKETVENDVSKALWADVESFAITRGFTADVVALLQSALQVPDSEGETLDPAAFLSYESFEKDLEIQALPAEGWILTRSHMLHVPTAATAFSAGHEVPPEAVKPAGVSLFTRGMVPCDYDPAATCPRWEQFVAEACPDDGEMLQMMFGLSLTYDRRYNVFFLIHGEAGTGKSTALDVLAALNAGAVCGVPLSEFGEKFQNYSLTEYRLNLVQDMERVFEGGGSVSHREAVLKSCTAGERLQVGQKYETPVLRRLSALPVFGGNVLPRFADRSRAIMHRMRIISFPRVFRGTDSQDLQLADALRAELPGILNWSLRGLGLLLAGGSRTFPESRASAAIKADSIKSARPEELFCDDELEATPDGSGIISTDNVYKAYQAYCIRSGYKTVGMNRVIVDICRYLGVEKSRISLSGKQRMCLVGVRFLETAADNAANDDF